VTTAKSDKVAVVGAGLMGTGIAYTFASADCSVLLIDRDQSATDRAQVAIGKLISEAVARGKLPADRADAISANLRTADGVSENLEGTSLFIETATEDIGTKQTIFREAERWLPPDALYATNTSALSITEIASVLKAPERLIGMHFFNPVQKMKLVELVKGLMTSEAAVMRACEWVARIGKTHILVNEAPGFTTSRMSALMGNEAMWMLAEGVASAEDIDTSLRLAFNHPMGPLELGDLTGWDTRLSVLEYLYRVFGERFRPCPLIAKMVKAKRYGRKTGRGVYEYDSAGQRIPGSGLKSQ